MGNDRHLLETGCREKTFQPEGLSQRATLGLREGRTESIPGTIEGNGSISAVFEWAKHFLPDTAATVQQDDRVPVRRAAFQEMDLLTVDRARYPGPRLG
jgi:hypothetical protein